MEKRDELEKEERTIFIVLAIIVLIAIGVLLTWYFTKDKKAEDKDSDTKTKTIETKKKEEEETEEDENVSYTVTTKEESNTPVVVLSSNVKANNEEVKIVDTAEAVEETPIVPVEPIEEITSYNESILWYLVGEKISFKEFMYNDIISITNGVISSVKYEGGLSADLSKYNITDGNIISFLEAGTYIITIESGNQSYEISVTIKSDEDVLTLIDKLIDSLKVDQFNNYLEYYDNDLYNQFISNANALKDSLDSMSNAAQAYQELKTLCDEYKASFRAQEFTNHLITEEMPKINGLLGDYFDVQQDGLNININVASEKKGDTINQVKDNLGYIASDILAKLQDNKTVIKSISSGEANLDITSSFEMEDLKTFAKNILKGEENITGETTLDKLINKEIDITVTMIDKQTVTYHMSFTGTASANASVGGANITSISNDDIVLVDTATAQAVVETDVKNEETDEKVISNDIISEEEPGEEVTEPSTFVKEEEDGTGLVKEDQIQESQALDPNLEVKETTLN